MHRARGRTGLERRRIAWTRRVSGCERGAMHLETARLTVRPWSHDEADRLLDIQSRIEVVKWLGDGEPVLMKDLDEAHARIDRYAERSATKPLGFWAVEVRETGVVAGTVILLTLPNAFDAGLPEVYAITHTTNERSQAVCRRLGLDDLGVMEKWYDEESRVYRTTPERWANRA